MAPGRTARKLPHWPPPCAAGLPERAQTLLAIHPRALPQRPVRLSAFTSYDAAIAQWFGRQVDEPFPARLAIGGSLVQSLRYGENPHQRAAFYRDGSSRPGIATARIVQGRELSYKNLSDTEAAYEAVAEFDQPAVVIVKHANPCGVATGVKFTSLGGWAWRIERPGGQWVETITQEDFERVVAELDQALRNAGKV